MSNCSAEPESSVTREGQVIAKAIAQVRSTTPPTTPQDRAALIDCAGLDYVEIMESETVLPTNEEWQALEDCIVTLGLADKLLIRLDPAEIGLVELFNSDTEAQVDCLTAKGWPVATLPPDEDGYIFWDVNDSTLIENSDFLEDAQACVEQHS